MSTELFKNRSKIIEASLPFLSDMGWTFAALAKGGETVGFDASQVRILFEGREKEAVKHYSSLLDQRMIQMMKTHPEFETMKTHQKVRYGVIARLQIMNDNKRTSHKLASFLKNPSHATLGPKLIFSTCSKIWYTAGDTSTDFNYYSKRTILAGVYGSTVAYWLKDSSENLTNTVAFLDNRLKDSARIPKIKQDLCSLANFITSPIKSLLGRN